MARHTFFFKFSHVEGYSCWRFSIQENIRVTYVNAFPSVNISDQILYIGENKRCCISRGAYHPRVTSKESTIRQYAEKNADDNHSCGCETLESIDRRT